MEKKKKKLIKLKFKPALEHDFINNTVKILWYLFKIYQYVYSMHTTEGVSKQIKKIKICFGVLFSKPTIQLTKHVVKIAKRLAGKRKYSPKSTLNDTSALQMLCDWNAVVRQSSAFTLE